MDIVCDKCGAKAEIRTKKIKSTTVSYVECTKCAEKYIGLIDNKEARAARKDKDKFFRLQKRLRAKYKDFI